MISYFQRKDQDHFNMREEIKKERIKKRVLKDHPNAYVDHDSNGYKIMAGNKFIAEDYFLPDTHDLDTAWEYAALACKTTQNFNRSHPDRMDLSNVENKLSRINNRKRRSRRVK
jgi:hypothetical protein